MEFDSNFYDAKIPLCLSRFFSLPQTEGVRFFFFSKDDERLRGITELIHLFFVTLNEIQWGRKPCLVINIL